MLRFFRQIRKNLMEQNKTRSYLLYAFGEILLVVIGILIALQINNWNEYRTQQSISNEAIQSLKTELLEAKSLLENVVNYNSQILIESEKFIYDEYNLDSLTQKPGKVFNWTDYRNLSLNLLIVEKEVSSEGLIIGNEKLNTKLREIKMVSQRLVGNLFYLDELWNNEVAPYFIKSKTMVSYHKFFNNNDVNIYLAKSIFLDEEYRNLTAMSNLLTNSFNDNGKQLIILIDEALVLIEETN